MTENGVVEKIEKLLALALNNPNAEEAASAMAKARELMLRHAIDEASLSGAKPASDTDVFIICLERRFEPWMKQVQAGVAFMFDAQCFISIKYSGSKKVDVTTIVCSAHDLPYIKQVYAQAVQTIMREATKRSLKGRAYVTSFRLGASSGFWRAVLTSKDAPLKPDENAMVHVKSEAIRVRSKELFPYTRVSKSVHKPTDYSGYSDGFDFGKSMSTGRGNKEIE